jgi:hypothetical protein
MPKPLMAIRPYLDQLRQACDKYSRDDLVAAILELAASQPSAAREAFLVQFRTILQKDRISTHPAADEGAELLAEIDDLVQQVSQRMDAIDDGSIYEEQDDWDGEYEERSYDWDEDPAPLTDSQRDDAEMLFARVDGLFLDRQFDIAAKAYEKLLKLFEMDYYPDMAVPVEEARARYYRSLLEITPAGKRARALRDAMLGGDQPSGWSRLKRAPRLREILDSAGGTVDSWDTLLAEWKKILAKDNGEYAVWLKTEVINMTEGLSGLEQFAIQQGDQEPLGFMAWIEAAQREGLWSEVRRACTKALACVRHRSTGLPIQDGPGRYRREFAEALLQAGRQLKDPETILRAYQEIFSEIPTDTNLARLLQQADLLERREDTLSWTCGQLEKSGGPAALWMKAELLRGHWATVFDLARKHKPSPLGWSSSENSDGLYVAAVLAALCGEAIAKAPAAGALLHRYADAQFHNRQFEEMRDDWDEEDEDFAEAHPVVKRIPQDDDNISDKFFSEAILTTMARSPLPSGDWKRYFDKVKTRSEARIKAILDGHKRGAYDRAAELLMALIQTQRLRGERVQADRMLEEYIKVRYNRFVAFKKELARFQPTRDS